MPERPQDARRQLVTELGIEPGEQLRDLERAILAQDPALSLPAVAPVELPAELASGTPIVGRDGDLEWLRAQWRPSETGREDASAQVGRRLGVVAGNGGDRVRDQFDVRGGEHLGGGGGRPSPPREALGSGRQVLQG